MMSRAHSRKGFRLIERLIIVSGIPDAVAIAMYTNVRERAKDAAVKGDFTCHRLALCSVASFGWGSLGLGDIDHAIRVA